MASRVNEKYSEGLVRRTKTKGNKQKEQGKSKKTPRIKA